MTKQVPVDINDVLFLLGKLMEDTGQHTFVVKHGDCEIRADLEIVSFTTGHLGLTVSKYENV